jgi:predicted ATPase
MKIVISGGPGTGKSTMINELSRKGYNVFEETSREIIKHYKKLGHEQLFLSNPIKFSEILLQNRINQFEDKIISNSEQYFFDRGIPDVLAYLDYKNLVYEDYFTVCANKYKYDMVFIVEPWKEIYKKDNQRYESFNELVRISTHIKKTYKNLGYKFFIIPNVSVTERIDYILNKIK